jgi:hypothetical protein
VAEQLHRDLVFLPVLSDPAPGAVEQVMTALRESVNEMRAR